MDLQLKTRTAEETRGVGEAVAGLLRACDAVVLTGELGAGKTTFVQGVARGLGVTEQVTSPTFTLVREYQGRLGIAHVDVYRLSRMQDVVDLGLEEIGDGQDVLLVEWGDVVQDLLPPDRLRVELSTEEGESDDDDEVRKILVSTSGGSWAERWEGLAGALSPWRVPE
jgi:tRNA threonylcarbamoyladenosine biosynthesis protein TsaE